MANFFTSIFNRLRSALTLRAEKARQRTFVRRLEDLERAKSTLAQITSETSKVDVSSISSPITRPKLPEVFVPRQFSPSQISMSKLWEEREEQERRRLKALEQSARRTLDQIKSFIKLEDANRAGILLKELSGIIKSLNDESLASEYQQAISSLHSLDDLLRERAIQEAEERRRREEELARRRREEEEARQRRIQKEREEKERRARELEEKIAREERERREEIQRLKALCSLSSEADGIKQYLRDKGVMCFYHFTDKRNVEMIKKYGGLYSWFYSLNHNIPVKEYGGDKSSRQYDRGYGLEDYVRLSFCSDHPMAYRKHNEGCTLVLLRIKADVALFKDVMFSDINAASASHKQAPGLAGLKMVNVRATKLNYVRTKDPLFAEHQAECMVRTFIPIEYIENIDCPKTMSFD